MTLEERRVLVYEVSRWSNGAHNYLQSWTRKDLVQILCAEMGKERKYTGTSKSKIVDHLLEIVSENKASKRVNDMENGSLPSPPNNQGPSKRQRKNDNPTRLSLPVNHLCDLNGNDNVDSAIYCQNSACRATLCQEDTFCKRCSCCICHKYDDNKDPSLWLVCNSDPPYVGDFCGLSCHVECALKNEQAGISKSVWNNILDGSFYCVSCKKVNDLLRFWRKQLLIAKDTRRVDTLCYRVLLSQKLLGETKKYQKLQEIVNLAAKKLESDVGPLFGLPVRTARGIVNRLSSGPEVQKLCASAVESLDSILSCSVSCPSSNAAKMQDATLTSPGLVSFHFVSPTSLDVILNLEHASSSSAKHLGFKFWHCKTCTVDYSMEPTHILYAPDSKFSLLDLTPATEYLLKVVSFCDTEDLGMWEVKFRTGRVENDATQCLIVERGQSSATNSSSLSNPSSSEGDESNNLITYIDQIDNPSGKHTVYYKKTATDSGKISDAGSKDASDSQNTSTGIGLGGRQGDSVSVLDEEGTMGEVGSVRNSTDHAELHSMQRQLNDGMSTDNESNIHAKEGFKAAPYEHGSDAAQPITPCKLEMSKDGLGRSCRLKSSNEEPENVTREADKDAQEGSPSKKRSGSGVCGVERMANLSFEREYIYCVKVIRWLECEGYIEKNFRVKFLTWYSLRASPEERRIVKVFIDTLVDDPLSLSGQLIDAFSERVFSKKSPDASSSGFFILISMTKLNEKVPVRQVREQEISGLKARMSVGRL
ncbi:hypothetical protein Syun_031555 [Stephania yunnanensis]|uniref:Oberon PHD finger domain-containing protein n=1 Tax=Stephania yunnanensis TaxID=152371 RepID=A0AAP0HF34_9MAGN